MLRFNNSVNILCEPIVINKNPTTTQVKTSLANITKTLKILEQERCAAVDYKLLKQPIRANLKTSTG